jgi:hypothetical protein
LYVPRASEGTDWSPMEKSRTCSSVMPCSVGSPSRPFATSRVQFAGIVRGSARSANCEWVESTDSAREYGSVTTTVRRASVTSNW